MGKLPREIEGKRAFGQAARRRNLAYPRFSTIILTITIQKP
jgi:hypothetical protein